MLSGVEFYGGIQMSQIENLREKLYKLIETGNLDDILRISQELDKLILHFYTNSTESTNKKSA